MSKCWEVCRATGAKGGEVCALHLPVPPGCCKPIRSAQLTLQSWGCSARLGICSSSEKQIGSLHVLGVKERLCSFDRNICVGLSEGFFHFIGLTS